MTSFLTPKASECRGERPPQFTKLTARCVRLDADDIDTDQIIPARFLKVTDKLGLGERVFCDWRGPEFVLDKPSSKGAQILVAGRNFGCGSSREHAPWALHGWGLRVIVARSFADIFRGNALKNGLIPVALDDTSSIKDGDSITVDLESCTVSLPDGNIVNFAVDEFARRCLLDGQDELGYLMARLGTIEEFENRKGQ